jgi:hypothetical protein
MWDTRFSWWILDFKLLASILLDIVGKFKFEALVMMQFLLCILPKICIKGSKRKKLVKLIK